MSHAEKIIEVVQAFADGKEIESRELGCCEWSACYSPIWNWAKYDYRVKHEPMERWLNIYDDCDGGIAHTTRKDADRDKAPGRVAVVRLVEAERLEG